MQLTDEQKQRVAEWVRGGAGLSDVQKRLSEEFKLSLTYMDVRFLVLDLGLTLKDKAAPKAPPPPVAPPPAPADGLPGDDADLPPDPFADEAAGDAGAPGGAVRVDLDRIMKPGAIVSGSVTFSDGVSTTWSLDQYGRLALVPPRPGYQPSPADVQSFQMELRRLLERRGF